MAVAAGDEPYHLLRPAYANHVWHMDLACLRILWLRFTIAAVLDGFSRKLLALRVYRRTPRSRDVLRLVQDAIRACGMPRFLITDHGTQFRKKFHVALARMKVRHVRGRVRSPFLNGKLERVFRTFRIWWRMVLVAVCGRAMQRRLDSYRFWYNAHRPHSALGGRTPEEAWMGQRLAEAIPLRALDAAKAWIEVRRGRCRGGAFSESQAMGKSYHEFLIRGIVPVRRKWEGKKWVPRVCPYASDSHRWKRLADTQKSSCAEQPADPCFGGERRRHWTHRLRPAPSTGLACEPLSVPHHVPMTHSPTSPPRLRPDPWHPIFRPRPPA
jgi:putative transposase